MKLLMEKLAQHIKDSEEDKYSFVLFVIDNENNSVRATNNLKRLCEEYLPGRYTIEIIDVLENFNTALEYNILLTPSVVVVNPGPKKVIHGDLSDTAKFIKALNLRKKHIDD